MSEIIVKQSDENYSTLPNRIVEDETLSWRAKGLLLYLANRPDGWEVRHEDLKSRATEGETAIQTAINELKDAGYIKIVKQRNKKGHITTTKWLIRLNNPDLRYPDMDSPDVDSPDKDNRDHSNNDINKKENNKNQYNEEAKQIFEFWLQVEAGTKHRSLREPIKKHVKARLNDGFKVNELKKAINNLAKAYNSDKYYWSHKWGLDEFMKREQGGKVEKFLDGIKWAKKDQKNSKNKTGRGITKGDLEDAH